MRTENYKGSKFQYTESMCSLCIAFYFGVFKIFYCLENMEVASLKVAKLFNSDTNSLYEKFICFELKLNISFTT